MSFLSNYLLAIYSTNKQFKNVGIAPRIACQTALHQRSNSVTRPQARKSVRIQTPQTHQSCRRLSELRLECFDTLLQQVQRRTVVNAEHDTQHKQQP